MGKVASRDAALELVDLLYGAALDARAWPAALTALARQLGATAAGIRFESFDPPGVRQTWTGLEPDFESAYVEHYWRSDPWAAAALQLAAGECVIGATVAPTEVLRGNSFFNELCRPFAIDDMLGGVVVRSPEVMVTVGVMKPTGAGHFDEGDLHLLRVLMPHLQRAVQVEQRLARADRDARFGWERIERLPAGVVVVDVRGRVRRCNRAAERLVGDGLVLGADGLGAATEHASALLRAHVAGALRGAALGGQIEPLAVRIPRPSGLPDLSVIAIPLCVGEAPFEERSPGALVMVIDPTAAIEPSAALLQALFGLTPAEARVALFVGRGLAPKDVAREVGSAYNTVRFQLGQVYAKCGVDGQAKLVRLLMSLGVGGSPG